jgi:hypothetical protein
MAGRPKKSANTDVKNTETNVNDAILAQLKELQEQMLALQAENKALKEKQVIVSSVDNNEDEITADTDITVISQTVGKLVLSTLGNGLGTIYRFEKFGDVQDIPFGDLREIVKNKPYFAREGMYYIANEQAVKKLRLGTQYKNIIDNKTLEDLFNKDSKTVIALYKSAPPLQQEQIVGLIEDRLANKLEVDGNVLIQIGKLCGKDFLINDEDE